MSISKLINKGGMHQEKAIFMKRNEFERHLK